MDLSCTYIFNPASGRRDVHDITVADGDSAHFIVRAPGGGLQVHMAVMTRTTAQCLQESPVDVQEKTFTPSFRSQRGGKKWCPMLKYKST
jgi:hypothetical protein